MFKQAIVILSLLLCGGPTWAGELFTEVGGGYLLPRWSSHVVLPECERVRTFTTNEIENCGGQGPAFAGWLLAWEFDNERTRIGLWHYSHWFDGNGESQFSCICASHKIRWFKN